MPAYVLDFLCIHPFADGNGRMARLLSLLLLYQAGYEVGRYIRSKRAIEETKEGYYDSLLRIVAGLARGAALAGAVVGVFRRRDAREGIPAVRGASRRHDARAVVPSAT